MTGEVVLGHAFSFGFGGVVAKSNGFLILSPFAAL
jgi:hypothetical protein